MTTSVWLCEPRRSHHGRRKAGHPVAGGRTPSFAVPHRLASPALCPCGYAASFCRRASCRSCVVVRVRRPCYRRRCCASARGGACGVQCGVLARGAVLLPRPLLRRRRVRCDFFLDSGRAWCCGLWKVRARWLCAWCARWVAGRVGAGLLSYLRAGRSVAAQAACVRPPPGPVLEMSLMPPQVVGAAAAAMSPLC